ncbi:hypothetical protein BDB01DRAFT_896031 [Pilobolus umbonatus]|nr:hypothetical protein BDB01DRAFT_896031 [Pilobolus umbonatus]
MEKTKVSRRRRSACNWKRPHRVSEQIDLIHYPPGPIHIVPSWNPMAKNEKPPYSYATIIGHAILTSQDRKLTLNEIYNWITENYPFYSNETQGWQNSIRHNLSLHKSFVKIERDSSQHNPPRKGCFWTIRQGREKTFIDNLQKPLNLVRKQQSMSHVVSRRQSNRNNLNNAVIIKEEHITSSDNRDMSLGHKRSSGRRGRTSPHMGIFDAFCPTPVPTNLNSKLPESEHTAPSTELCQVSSPSSISSYNHQLFYNVPDNSESYNVYPDLPLHGSIYDDDQFPLYDTSYSADNINPSSLSPCDTYSTISSFADSNYVTHNESQDLYYNGMFTHSKSGISPVHENTYNDTSYTQKTFHYLQPEETMDWTPTNQIEDIYMQLRNDTPNKYTSLLFASYDLTHSTPL